MRPPTSIYRQYTRLADDIARPVDRMNRDESARPEVAVDFTQQRRAVPVAFLLPNTQKWLDALPHEVRPHALCKLYARIANLIAATWADTETLSAYFNELLADRRRGRRGFPPDVFNDLRVLRDYHAALHPNAIGNWDHERRRK